MQSGLSLRRVLSGLPAATRVALMLTLVAIPAISAESLPVKDPATVGLKAIQGQISNLIDIDQIYAGVKDGDDQGLFLDLSGITTLLDGTPVDSDKIYGSIYVGPYPMEARSADYDLKRFRIESVLKHGKGRLALAYLLQAPHNSEGWTDAGVVALRVALGPGDARPGPETGRL
jgi:hypothetical protein